MASKVLAGLAAGIAMMATAATAGPAVERAQRIEGTVLSVDRVDHTVIVGTQTFSVIGRMPHLRAGERVVVTYLISNGRLIGWIRPVALQS